MDQTLLLLGAAETVPALDLSVRIPLSILNFLEFAIWGAWFVVLGNYLNSLQFSRKDIGRIYATMSLGSVIAPMFVGTIADRYFASEQLMGGLHLVGALLLYAMAQLRTPRGFYWTALVYALVYAPTLALVNSVVFANVPDAERDFPTIRVVGTIGWIAAGMSLSFLIPSGQQINNRPLLLASALSLVLGVYSFFLPHTPPAASGSGAEARAELGLGAILAADLGAGYKEPPTVLIEGGGGSGATAKALIKDGEVKGFEVTSEGKGYTSVPTIKLTGGGGASALAKLHVVAVNVVHPGSGYQVPPAIGLTGGGGKEAEVKAQLTEKGEVGSIQVVKKGSDYTSPPSVNFPTAEIPFLKAFALLKEPSFAVFFGVSFLITLALAFYYSFTALFLEKGLHVKPQNIGSLMTIGQWVEIIFMFTLTWFLKSLGMKWVLAIGMAAWGVRYAIFASRGPLPLILFGIALHGICFDFFFAAGFIHVQKTAPAEIQASGQSLFAVLTYGLGMWLGTEASGWLNQYFTKETIDPVTGEKVKVTDWTKFWLVPAVGVLISLALFLLLF
jgi:MFS family permease